MTSNHYNIIFKTGNRRNNNAQTRSYDGYTNDGEVVFPIDNLITTTDYIRHRYTVLCWMNVFDHLTGAYLISFAKKYGWPDAPTVDKCTNGAIFEEYKLQYPAFNKYWKYKQTQAGILRHEKALARQVLAEMTPASEGPAGVSASVIEVDEEGYSPNEYDRYGY